MIEEHKRDLAEAQGHVANQKAPPHIKAMVHYFHSLTEIWEYYRALGNNPPPEFAMEMKRAETEIIQALKEEAQQGGSLHDYYQTQERKP